MEKLLRYMAEKDGQLEFFAALAHWVISVLHLCCPSFPCLAV